MAVVSVELAVVLSDVVWLVSLVLGSVMRAGCGVGDVTLVSSRNGVSGNASETDDAYCILTSYLGLTATLVVSVVAEVALGDGMMSSDVTACGHEVMTCAGTVSGISYHCYRYIIVIVGSPGVVVVAVLASGSEFVCIVDVSGIVGSMIGGSR